MQVLNRLLVKDGYLLFDNLDSSSGEAIDCYTLFLYLVDNNIRVSYIVRRGSLAHQQAISKGLHTHLKVLGHSPFSVSCFFSLFFTALKYKYVVTSHGRIHFMLARLWKKSNSTCYIHAQHGVTWLKHSSFNILSPLYYDKLVVSSEKEARFAIENGWEQDNLIPSGLFRFDRLKYCTKQTEVKKHILFMFTWRSTFDEHESTHINLEKSSYAERIESLLNRAEIRNLIDTNIEIIFAEHHYMKDFGLGKVRVPAFIKLADTKQLSKAIKNACMLVTDYSSSCFDFMYQSKPVVFYHLDFDDNRLCEKDKYEQRCVRNRNDSLFNVYENEEDIIQALNTYVKNDFTLEPEKKKIADTYFFRGQSSCLTFIQSLQQPKK